MIPTIAALIAIAMTALLSSDEHSSTAAYHLPRNQTFTLYLNIVFDYDENELKLNNMNDIQSDSDINHKIFHTVNDICLVESPLDACGTSSSYIGYFSLLMTKTLAGCYNTDRSSEWDNRLDDIIKRSSLPDVYYDDLISFNRGHNSTHSLPYSKDDLYKTVSNATTNTTTNTLKSYKIDPSLDLDLIFAKVSVSSLYYIFAFLAGLCFHTTLAFLCTVSSHYLTLFIKRTIDHYESVAIELMLTYEYNRATAIIQRSLTPLQYFNREHYKSDLASFKHLLAKCEILRHNYIHAEILLKDVLHVYDICIHDRDVYTAKVLEDLSEVVSLQQSTLLPSNIVCNRIQESYQYLCDAYGIYERVAIDKLYKAWERDVSDTATLARYKDEIVRKAEQKAKAYFTSQSQPTTLSRTEGKETGRRMLVCERSGLHLKSLDIARVRGSMGKLLMDNYQFEDAKAMYMNVYEIYSCDTSGSVSASDIAKVSKQLELLSHILTHPQRGSITSRPVYTPPSAKYSTDICISPIAKMPSSRDKDRQSYTDEQQHRGSDGRRRSPDTVASSFER